jgi:DNA-binding MurR/RpiR family transcriptional regulator
MLPRPTADGQPSETFDALRERIRDRFENLSPHLQRIAKMALDRPNELALNTIAITAETLKVQPSAMIRFAKEFGYDGFSGLQQVFKLRMIEGEPVYRERVFKKRASGRRPEDVASQLDGCIDTLIASLERLRQDISPIDLARAVELCLSARHIYVAGQRRSHPIATYFTYGMNRLEQRCGMLDFTGGMAGQQVANMNHDDLLVAIAFPPYTAAVVDLVRDAHVRGLNIVAITDTMSSPMARSASLSFCVDGDSTGQFRPISGAIGLVQSIIEDMSRKL